LDILLRKGQTIKIKIKLSRVHHAIISPQNTISLLSISAAIFEAIIRNGMTNTAIKGEGPSRGIIKKSKDRRVIRQPTKRLIEHLFKIVR